MRPTSRTHPYGLGLSLLVVAWVGLVQCHYNNESPEEKFVSVRLNDSLQRFDSVQVSILVAGDTSTVVGTIWAGHLSSPGTLADFRLEDGEQRTLVIRVRAFNKNGLMLVNELISKVNGKQVVNYFPLPTPISKDTSRQAWKDSALVTVRLNNLNLAPADFLTNFPLLIRLKSDNFNFKDAAESGNDLRFVNMDGSILSYEISQWDTIAGKADVWVKLDSVRGVDQALQLKMYWGNPSAPATSDGSKVFAADAGYSGVWHLSEAATGTTGEFKEATGKYPGTAGFGDGKSLPKRVDGVVGYGQDFQPGNNPGTISIPPDFDPGPVAWTFQGWIRMQGEAKGVIFTKGIQFTTDLQRFKISSLQGSSHPIALQRSGANFTTDNQIDDGTWTYLSIVYDGSSASIYIDGVLDGNLPWTQGNDPYGNAVFGANDILGNDLPFDGSMDELWFSSKARPPAWILVSYENQKNNSSLVTVKSFP